jgi:hypothetical protein
MLRAGGRRRFRGVPRGMVGRPTRQQHQTVGRGAAGSAVYAVKASPASADNVMVSKARSRAPTTGSWKCLRPDRCKRTLSAAHRIRNISLGVGISPMRSDSVGRTAPGWAVPHRRRSARAIHCDTLFRGFKRRASAWPATELPPLQYPRLISDVQWPVTLLTTCQVRSGHLTVRPTHHHLWLLKFGVHLRSSCLRRSNRAHAMSTPRILTFMSTRSERRIDAGPRSA